MHTWSVERAVHRVCGIVRGAAAILLAPVFDWVYPPIKLGLDGPVISDDYVLPDAGLDSEPSGYCSEPSEPGPTFDQLMKEYGL